MATVEKIRRDIEKTKEKISEQQKRLRTLEAQLERLRRISSMTPMRLSKSRQEHLDILNALSDRDLDAATDALRLHLRNIKSSTLAVCRSQSVVY